MKIVQYLDTMVKFSTDICNSACCYAQTLLKKRREGGGGIDKCVFGNEIPRQSDHTSINIISEKFPIEYDNYILSFLSMFHSMKLCMLRIPIETVDKHFILYGWPSKQSNQFAAPLKWGRSAK